MIDKIQYNIGEKIVEKDTNVISNKYIEIANKLDELVTVLKTTLGPSGKNVMIYKDNDYLRSTKDGVSIINSFRGKSVAATIAIEMLRKVSNRSVKLTGDGTTSTAILLNELIQNWIRFTDEVDLIMTNQYIISNFRERIESVYRKLDELSTKLDPKDFDKIYNLAHISTNGDKELSELVTEAFKLAGEYGEVNIKEGFSTVNDVTSADGYTFKVNNFNPYFHTNMLSKQSVYDKPLILVSEKLPDTITPLIPIMEYCREKDRTLIIVADKIDPTILNAIVTNTRRGVLKCIHIKPQAYGKYKDELLQDLVALTGTSLHNEDDDLRTVAEVSKQLGVANNVTVDSVEGIVTIESGIHLEVVTNGINNLIKALEVSKEKSDNQNEKDYITKRINNLSGKIVTILAGGTSDVEVKEKIDRLDDAVGTVKSAIKSGYLPGGGSVLFRLGWQMVDNADIFNMTLGDALQQITVTLENNAYNTSSYMEDNVNDFNVGINYRTGEEGNLYEMGIIEPTEVVKTALESAYSIFEQFILVSEIIHIEDAY